MDQESDHHGGVKEPLERGFYILMTRKFVATYRISRQLPKELEGQLPSPEEIARLLDTVE